MEPIITSEQYGKAFEREANRASFRQERFPKDDEWQVFRDCWELWRDNFYEERSAIDLRLVGAIGELVRPIANDIKGRSVLDLGSGNGAMLHYFHANFETGPSFGIEFREDNCVLSNRVFFKFNIPITVEWGNFFPPDFEVSHGVKWSGVPKEIADKYEQDDPYSRLAEKGFRWEDIKMVYAMQFDNNIDWIIKLLSERCSSGTYVLIAAPKLDLDHTLPDNIEFANRASDVSLLVVK